MLGFSILKLFWFFYYLFVDVIIVTLFFKGKHQKLSEKILTVLFSTKMV